MIVIELIYVYTFLSSYIMTPKLTKQKFHYMQLFLTVGDTFTNYNVFQQIKYKFHFKSYVL